MTHQITWTDYAGEHVVTGNYDATCRLYEILKSAGLDVTHCQNQCCQERDYDIDTERIL